MKTDNFIVVSEVTKSFGSFLDRHKAKALDNISFTVHRGEVLGLFGAAGSGKSTILKLLSGALGPDKGLISVLEIPLRNSTFAAKIGYMPAGFTLDPRLPCANVLSDFAGDLGLAPAQRLKRTQELFDFIGASDATQRAFGELPAATQRCVCIGRAVALDFEILILDDPLAGLDSEATRTVKQLIRKLARSGRTVVMASHWLADAMETCDRAIILSGGRIQARGTLQEIFAVPGALSVIGPLLSPGVRHKATEVIWQELCSGNNHAEAEATPLPNEEPAKDLSMKPSVVPEQQTNADKLSTLTAKTPAPPSDQTPPATQPDSNELTRANEKLAALLGRRGGAGE